MAIARAISDGIIGKPERNLGLPIDPNGAMHERCETTRSSGRERCLDARCNRCYPWPSDIRRIYQNNLIGLEQTGRACEVCDGHVPMHTWVDMDPNGFITNCPYNNGEKWET